MKQGFDFKSIRFQTVAVAICLLLFFIVFTTVSLHRYWQYAAWYYDFGIFYQAISSVAQGREPVIDHFIFTNQNILGDHFHPLIFLVSPFVALFPQGETLLIFQTAFVTLSGLFVYLIAKELLKNKTEALAMLVVYLSFIGLHNALITEFHEIALLPLPLSIFFYGMVKKHKWWYIIGLIGVLLAKESTFIIPAWFGLVTAWKNKGIWRKIGLATTIFSGIYGLTVLYVLFPAINGKGYHYLAEAVDHSKQTSPFTPIKVQTVLKTLVSFGFFPLLSPETVPPIIFNWWSRFSSLAHTRHDLGMHYNAEIAPTLILGTVYGWMRFKKIVKKSYKKITKKQFELLLALFAVSALFFSTYILKSPALLFTNPAFYKHTENFEFLDRLITHIPEDGTVMAQTNIAAKIAYRKVYMLRNEYKQFDPDYIVVDTRDGQEPNIFLGVTFSKFINDLENDEDYEVIYDQGEQKIYGKVR